MNGLFQKAGLSPACAVLTALAIAALVAATVWDVPALHGISLYAAFMAGAAWARPVLACDECGEALEKR